MPHTPGPWTCPNDGQNIVRSGERLVAAIYDETDDKRQGYKIRPAAEAVDNARLITAAPTMLRVLRDLIALSDASPEYCDLSDLIEDVKVVVAEATTLPPS